MLALNIPHGAAYALTDAGSGRSPLPPPEDAWFPRGANAVASHAVQPTSDLAPMTMSWVVDLDPGSCSGCAETILHRFQEAVVEVMLAEGVSLSAGMEPPQLPPHFVARPMADGYEEAGAAGNADGDVTWARRI